MFASFGTIFNTKLRGGVLLGTLLRVTSQSYCPISSPFLGSKEGLIQNSSSI